MKKLLLLFLLILAPIFAKEKLDADYNKGEELQIIEKQYIKGYSVSKYDIPIDASIFSIYWNPQATNYYFVEDGVGMIRTNGLTYKIDTSRLETSYTGENLDPFLTYVGYIKPNMRLYIDNRNTNQQYIKILEPIQDTGDLKEPLLPARNTPASMMIYTPTGYGSGKGRFYDNKGAIFWEDLEVNLYPNLFP